MLQHVAFKQCPCICRLSENSRVELLDRINVAVKSQSALRNSGGVGASPQAHPPLSRLRHSSLGPPCSILLRQRKYPAANGRLLMDESAAPLRIPQQGRVLFHEKASTSLYSIAASDKPCKVNLYNQDQIWTPVSLLRNLTVCHSLQQQKRVYKPAGLPCPA